MRLPLLILLQFRASSAGAVEWNVISGDRAIVSSRCLGSNATVQCAADTAVACSAWTPGTDLDPLCHAFEGAEWGFGLTIDFGPQELLLHSYYIDQWIAEADDIDTTSPYRMKPGDTVVDFYLVTRGPEAALPGDARIRTLSGGNPGSVPENTLHWRTLHLPRSR